MCLSLKSYSYMSVSTNSPISLVVNPAGLLQLITQARFVNVCTDISTKSLFLGVTAHFFPGRHTMLL